MWQRGETPLLAHHCIFGPKRLEEKTLYFSTRSQRERRLNVAMGQENPIPAPASQTPSSPPDQGLGIWKDILWLSLAFGANLALLPLPRTGSQGPL